MLGATQWSWLEGVLSEKNVDLRIIVSSIQVLSEGHAFEAWRLFPSEQGRLMEMLTRGASPPKSIILSGDRHIGGIYEKNGVTEITSSSLTHTYTGNTSDETGPYLLTAHIQQNNVGIAEIDWQDRKVNLRLVLADGKHAGKTLASHTLLL